MKLSELKTLVENSPLKQALGSLFQDMLSNMYYKTPVGFLEIISNEDGVIRADFVDEVPPNSLMIKSLEPLSINFSMGTEIQQIIWKEVCKIPKGETRSYGEIAKILDDKRIIARTVGSAMAANPVVYLIPCHRVVKADGSIGNYSSGGALRKQLLLDWEKQHAI